MLIFKNVHMKKRYIYLVATAMMLFASCEDATDIFPVDQVVAEDALTTPEDIEVAASGAFSAYNPQLLIQFSSRFTDDLRLGGANGGQGVNEINQQITANSGIVNGIYTSYYAAINRANRVLDAINELSGGALNPSQIESLRNLEGQMLALRALSHFDLLTLFAPSYDNDTDLAVPYIDFVVTFELPARNTVGEVFSAIEADLATAEGLLQSDSKLFFNPDFVTALRAKIALFRGDNQAAISLSNQLIAQIPLANRSQYMEMYFDRDDTEVIYKLPRTVADPRVGGLFYFTGTGGAFLEMSFGLFSSLDPQDVRFDVLVDDDMDGGAIDPVSNPPTTIFIKKYPGRDGQFGLNDIKMYRISEQYLILAEAQARAGQLSQAAATIDILRDARYGNDQVAPVYGTLLDAINDILTERRIELAYEGHRFIDIRRNRAITNTGVVRDMADCGGPTPCVLVVNDFRFTLPIPQAEIDINPNVVQNDGY